MRNWHHMRTGLLSVVLLAVVFGTVGFAGSAEAQFEKDIINTNNGTKIGSITFPATTGTDPSGAGGVLLDTHDGFNETHITSVSWTLDTVTRDVQALSLNAFKGDDPCPAGFGQTCSKSTLTLSPTSLSFSSASCSFFECRSGSSSTPIEFVEVAPAYACIGFEPPLADGPVTVKKNRALPLRAELIDDFGVALEDGDLNAPPVVQVIYDSGVPGDSSIDVSDDALPAGQGMDGNIFVFTESGLQFNLKVKKFEAAGTYTITMVSGNGAEYLIAPTCTAQFVIE